MTASDAARFEALRRHLTAVPADGAAAFELAKIASRTGREADALPLVEGAASRIPNSPALHQFAGSLARSLDRHDRAASAFAEAARLAPSDAKIAYGHALVALESGLPSAALFERGLALAPLDGSLLLGHAAARLAEGRMDLAIAELDTVLADHPGWFGGHERLAQLRWMAGDRDGFVRSLDRALADTPGDPGLWRTLLVILAQAGLNQRLLDEVARARAFAGQDGLFDVMEATALSELGRHDLADALFVRLAGTADPALDVRRVRHLLRTGRADEAALVAERHVGTPQETQFWPYLGTAWRLTGDARAAWLEGDPRLIAQIDLADRLPALDRLADRLRELHAARVYYFEQSVRGGTQTDGPLFSRLDPEIRALRAACVGAVEAYIAQLPPPSPHPMLRVPRDRPVRFSGSWSVRLEATGRHDNHVHPQGWISSAFYVALPTAEERGAGQAGWLTLGQPPAELGIDLPPLRVVEPKPGRLVLFPSTKWHGTVPFARGERLTVAFDVAKPAWRG